MDANKVVENAGAAAALVFVIAAAGTMVGMCVRTWILAKDAREEREERRFRRSTGGYSEAQARASEKGSVHDIHAGRTATG